MKKIFIAYSLALLLLSCNTDDDMDNNNDSGIQTDPTFTVTYAIRPSNDPPAVGQYMYDIELVGELPIDDNKYKSGNTVTLMPINFQLKDKGTDTLITHPFKWVVIGTTEFIGELNPDDEFIIKEDTIVAINIAMIVVH